MISMLTDNEAFNAIKVEYTHGLKDQIMVVFGRVAPAATSFDGTTVIHGSKSEAQAIELANRYQRILNSGTGVQP